MWSSAMHFAIGFFGYPFEGQYEQSITIEHEGVSAPRAVSLRFSYFYLSALVQQHTVTGKDVGRVWLSCISISHATLLSCPNEHLTNRATWYVRRWVEMWVWASLTAVQNVAINSYTDTSRLRENVSMLT
jgi:hypothetical protein